MKKYEVFAVAAVLTLAAAVIGFCFIKFYSPPPYVRNDVKIIHREKENSRKKFIKWAEFNPTSEMLDAALKYDVESQGEISFTSLLAYSSAKSYGRITKDSVKFIDEGAEVLKNGTPVNLKYFDYYKEVYDCAVGGFVGKKGKGYGLLAYSPIAKGFSYSHYNDFGAARNHGFSRPHKGNDLLGSVGTPIVAIESGTVEALGWNNYGGWRIGIRSNDRKRYWYYAHLRKDYPFREGLKEGDKVFAGQVIGYMGMTGYSSKENVNNINTPHLHLGLELIFDESQKDCVSEIWVDVYNIVEFLEKNRSEVIRSENNKAFIEK